MYNFYKLLKRLNKLKNPASIYNEIVKSDTFTHIIENIAAQRSKDKNGKIIDEKYADALEKDKKQR